jgi:hypothetical protein
VLGPCCIGTFAGIILGIVGLQRIRSSKSPLRGAGLARAGILVGAGLLAIEILLASQFARYTHDRIETQAWSAVNSVLIMEQPPPALWVRREAGGPTGEEVAAWRQQTVVPLGQLRNVRITHREQSSWPPLRVSVAFTADFDSGSVLGGAYFVQGQQSGMDITLLLQRLELDVNGTRSSLPPAPSTSPPATAPGDPSAPSAPST